MAILLVACLLVIAWVYVSSPAKRLLGLFVLRPNGSRVGLGRRFFRSMVSTLTFGIGHSMIIFRQDKRGLHDLFADTVVVRGGETAATYGNDVPTAAVATYLPTAVPITAIVGAMTCGTQWRRWATVAGK